MTNELIQTINKELTINTEENGLKKAIIYVDYENIYGRLQDYGKTIFELNFVEKLKKHFENIYQILDFIFYANFDLEHFHASFHQTYLQSLGITTRHTFSQGKNASDIYLVVDALNSVYKNELLEVLIIISCDRDMIPLIQTAKKEGKFIHLITTKNGVEKSIMSFAHQHEFLENILNIKVQELDISGDVNINKLNENDIQAAEQIINLLINSNIWSRYKYNGIPINFNEYKKHVSRAKRIVPDEVERLFKIANAMGWIDFYNYKRKDDNILGIKEGKAFNKYIEYYNTELLTASHTAKNYYKAV